MSREIGKKDPGTIRVIALGDSITEGLGVQRIKDVWPALLEDKLKAAFEQPTEVINTGTTGWDLMVYNRKKRSLESGQFVPFVKQEIGALKPDLVIYCICINDIPPHVADLFHMDSKKNKQRFPIIPPQYRDWYRHQRFRSLDFSVIPIPDLDKDLLGRAIIELVTLKKELKHLEAGLYGIIVPYRYQLLPQNEHLRPVTDQRGVALDQAGIPFVDMSNHLPLEDLEDYFIWGDYIHPNAKGHDLIAQQAFFLIENDLKKRLFRTESPPPR